MIVILFAAILLILVFLLYERKIWFVYPDKNIYSIDGSIIFPVNKDMKNVLFWQYHNSAIIEGINTKVDLNVFKGNISELRKLVMK